MKSFKYFLKEEFESKAYEKLALKWLENKYGKDLYTFKFIPNMDMNGEKVKVYDVSVDNKEFALNLKLFDTNGDGSADTLGFDIKPAVEKEEEEL